MSQVTSQNALVKDSTVQTLNSKLDNINASIGGNANIAPVFNTSTAYSKGDMVNYSGDLYVFTANHAAGAWTGSDAVQTKVSSELSSLKSGLTNVSIYTDCKGTSQASTLEHVRAVYNSTTKIIEISGYISDVSFAQGLTVIDHIVTVVGKPSADTAISIFTTESVNAYAYVTTSGNLAVNSDTAFDGTLFLGGVYTVG